MNWGLLAISVYFLLIVGALVFALAYARVHPKELLHPIRLQSKIQSITLFQVKVFAYLMVWLVGMHLLLGIALVAWAIVEIAKTIW
jgi:hypothetical protein